MRSMESLGAGFLAGAGIVWGFNIVSLFRNGDTSIALLYLTVLVIPVSTLLYLKLKNANRRTNAADRSQLRNFLFSCQGVALGFWAFDVVTTFYGINVTGLAVELNPLGWPLGILSGFAFYGPSVVLSYFLLFKSEENVLFYAAAPLTMLTLAMGAMNLRAGAQNLQVFLDSARLATGVNFGLSAALGTVCLMVPFALKGKETQPEPLSP